MMLDDDDVRCSMFAGRCSLPLSACPIVRSTLFRSHTCTPEGTNVSTHVSTHVSTRAHAIANRRCSSTAQINRPTTTAPIGAAAFASEPIHPVGVSCVCVFGCVSVFFFSARPVWDAVFSARGFVTCVNAVVSDSAVSVQMQSLSRKASVCAQAEWRVRVLKVCVVPVKNENSRVRV